jgi:hypothetical protein
MPEIVADPPTPSCNHLFYGIGIQESQLLGPDRSSLRARGIARRHTPCTILVF